ncbi:DUF2635 domain-containing protein [Photobacterium sp. WH24]|uniref:DUF2635 domain-containing protein n=1 Tax=Photobacterium sp. WH24 TaxID=2827237 RepID=UPI001C4833EC|nr:DUF2635 domain-containing protein [Photobacterium sp. WH24]MBV7262563.1 DUF2635 domain-containing protein [Photobacterium sp. WH24]
MNQVILKPAAADVKVRKPDGSHLNEAGEAVTINSYWRRRLYDGSVVETQPEPAKKAAKPQEQ